MTRGPKYPLNQATPLVEEIKSRLSPYIINFQPVGSIGRHESMVGDIDILVYPAKYTSNNKSGVYMIGQIERELKLMGQWHKGGTRAMTIRNVLDSPFQLDLFLCHPPAQWGVLVGVRLNPAEFVIWAKAKIDSLGYVRENGTIFKDGVEIKVPTEQDYFKLLGLDWVPAGARRELCWRMGLEPL